MKAPEIPPEETERQAALERTGLLDTEPEERFDRYTRMARKAFRVPIALFAWWTKTGNGSSPARGSQLRKRPATYPSAVTPFTTRAS